MSTEVRTVALIPLLVTMAVAALFSAASHADCLLAAPVPGQPQGIFYDTDGLIVHRTPEGKCDGGDTAQREGWYWLGVWLRQNVPGLTPWPIPRALTFDQVLALLEPGHDGLFYRHPKLEPWNHPREKAFGFSRDQMEPLVAAMGMWGKEAEVRRLWEALPEDLMGKHTFNGNWRNFLGQDGSDCTAIKKRSCDAVQDCSLKKDDRDCSLQVAVTPCALNADNRSCPLNEDTRSCGHEVTLCTPGGCVDVFGGQICTPQICHTETINDPACEAAKAAQNLLYKGEHDACEAAKAAQNLAYKAEHDKCEGEKATLNLAYKLEHDACEAGKLNQNLLYKAEHDACEAEKAGKKGACEAQKAADQLLCGLTNVHSGDLIGPMTVNLFRRALNEDPMSVASSLRLPPVNVGGGNLGEVELGMNVGLRLAAAGRDKGDVGDDLNLIVKLLMSRLRSPSSLSQGALALYASSRPHSYGSYFGAYRAAYGNDATDIEKRMEAGVAAGWQPDVFAPVGAIRWYHRPDTGANPQLIELYESIVNLLMK